MNLFTNILNNFAMIPYSFRGINLDGDRPYDISMQNSDSHVELPQQIRLLLVASDKHYRFFDTRQFLDPADKIYDALSSIIGIDNITYIQGDENVRKRLKPELEILAREDDATKLFIFLGHGFRQHPYFGSSARNMFLNDEHFLEIISEDDCPWIAIFDNCFSGLFAQNVAKRPNTMTVSTETARTIKPCPRYLPGLIKEWASGKDLMTAFKESSQDYYDHSFDYLLADSTVPRWSVPLLRRIDDRFRVSSAAKQLYSNGIDPSLVYLNVDKR